MSNLLELLTILQPSTNQADLSADGLLEQVLPTLLQHIPHAQSVRALRNTRDGMILWQSTEADVQYRLMRFQDHPSYKEVVTKNSPITDEKQSRFLIPLISGDEVSAILDIQFEVLPDINDFDWLIHFTYQLGVTLDQRHLNDLIAKQTRALSQLVDANTFEEIASILAKVILRSGQFVAINIFQKDELGNLEDVKAVITANRQKTLQADASYQYDKPYLNTMFTIMQEDDYLIADVQTDPLLNDTVRKWLLSYNIVSVYNLPLRDNDNTLYGFVGINDTRQTIAISPSEAQIYRNLVAQASFTIQSQNLIQKVIDEAEETRILYQITRDLIAADSVANMLPIVRNNLGRVADRIQYIEIEYDDAGNLTDMIVSHQLSKGDDKVVSEPHSILSIVKPEDIDGLIQYWQRIGNQVEIHEDILDPDIYIPLEDKLKEQSIRSVVTFPIFSDGKRIAQLSLAWVEPQNFTSNYHRLAQALPSQMTLIIENQRYLQKIQVAARASDEQVKLLQHLNTIASASNTSQDEVDFLKKIVDILVTTTQVDHVGITIVQRDGEKATVVAESPAGNAVGQEVDIKGEIFVKMRQEKNPVIIHNVAESENLTEETRAVLKMVGVKHLMIVPFFNIDDELIGTIGLDLYNEKSRFTEKMQTVAITVSSQIATSLQKLRLLDDTRRQVSQIQLVSKFGQSIQATSRDDEILALALQYTLQVVKADYLAMIKYENGMFWRMPYYENGRNNPSSPDDALEKTRIALLQSVVDSNEILVIQDQRYHEPRVEYPLFDTYLSLILLPVSAQGRSLGIVEIASKQAYTYRISDIASLEQMTSQFGSALLNASEFAKSQRIARNRAKVNDISVQLQQQADVNGMLNVTVTELGRLLNAKQGRIRLGINKTNEN